MTENKRFKRYLLDGGFWFDEYVKPIWSINDSQNKDNPIGFIEFKDEYKDLCDDIVDELNNLHEENKQLKQHIQTLQKQTKRLENQNIQTYTLIKEALANERTQLGQSVLKQLMERIQ